MKSYQSRALIVLLVVSLALAGCKVVGTDTPTTSENSATATTPAEKAAEPTTATVVTETVAEPTQPAAGEAYPAPETVESITSGYPSQLPEGALFQLVLVDGSLLYPNKIDLAKCAPVTITADGQEKTGVMLIDLLNLYGISGYQSMTIDGATYSAQFGVEQVNDQVILEANADGATVNLVAASLTADAWVMQVSRITLQ